MEQHIAMAVLSAVAVIVVLAVLGWTRRPTSPGLTGTPARRRDLRARPRWLQELKAEAGGFFWVPCPMCGEAFGGHEWAGELMDTRESGRGVCANCAQQAAKLNRERFPDMYGPNTAHVHVSIKP